MRVSEPGGGPGLCPLQRTQVCREPAPATATRRQRGREAYGFSALAGRHCILLGGHIMQASLHTDMHVFSLKELFEVGTLIHSSRCVYVTEKRSCQSAVSQVLSQPRPPPQAQMTTTLFSSDHFSVSLSSLGFCGGFMVLKAIFTSSLFTSPPNHGKWVVFPCFQMHNLRSRQVWSKARKWWRWCQNSGQRPHRGRPYRPFVSVTTLSQGFRAEARQKLGCLSRCFCPWLDRCPGRQWGIFPPTLACALLTLWEEGQSRGQHVPRPQTQPAD